MADKYNLDYFDDDRVAAQRSQYRREYRQPMNRPPQNGEGLYLIIEIMCIASRLKEKDSAEDLETALLL